MGTQEKSGLGIEIGPLGAYLEVHIDGFRGLRTCQQFATGQSNPTYQLTADSGRYVLRAKPPGVLLKSAHMVEREYRVMAALAGSAVPVPRMLHLAEGAASPLGRSFFVMQFLDGRFFWDPALPELGQADRGAIYDAMNQTLAALHSVDIESAGLADFGKPGNYFARQMDRWSRQYRASAVTPLTDIERLIDWLMAHMPADDGQVALVHGDYRLDNMAFAPDRAQVIGLLDWELSTLGHPLADLAYQCMQWRLPYKGDFRGLGGVDRAAQGLPDEDEYVAAYLDRRGAADVQNWPFYLAFSFFRLAAILEGVAQRARDGNAANPAQGAKYGAAVPVLGRLALEIIGK